MAEPAKQEKLAVLILAAGKGTRMKNPQMAKVMQTINRKPMVDYVVDLAGKLLADRIILIVGWQKDNVIGYFSGLPYKVEFVEQSLERFYRRSPYTIGRCSVTDRKDR
jgi:bifunctional N-acetylglucosamine-1-phosphate-uridyltransferase/glucosamine-1-phosphate-acetyltransferase GlmU-like protein